MISLPAQNIPESEKDQKWVDQCLNAIIQLAGVNVAERERDFICYDIYHGVWSERQFDYLRKIENLEYPAMIRHIPIQRPRIDLLIGQELGRPLKLRSFCTNRDRVLLKQERKRLGILDTLLDTVIQQQMAAQQLSDFFNQQKALLQDEQRKKEMQYDERIPMMAEQIMAKQKGLDQVVRDISERIIELDRKYRYDYRDEMEISSERILQYIIQEQHAHEKFLAGFTDSLICGKERYFVDCKYDGHPPILRKVNPLRIQHSQDEGALYLHECNWVKTDNEMSFPELLDEFPELQLDPNKLKQLAESSGLNDIYNRNGGYTYINDPTVDYCEPGTTSSLSSYNQLYQDLRNSPAKYTVHRCYWKSTRRVNIKESEKSDDPTIKFTHWVEDKEIGDGKGIRYRYLEDIWCGISCNGVTLRSGRMANQYRPVDEPAKSQMPFFGPVFNNRTRRPYSLVWATKDIQILFNLVHYHWELMMATAGNRGLIMDKAQMPKDMSMGEWRYQKKSANTAWINSAQTYNNIKPTFNAFTTYDDSLSPSIQYLEGVMDKLEDLCGNAIGVPRGRFGALKTEDAVGNSKIANVQSSLITDIKYYEHDIIKNQVLTYMVNIAKRTLKEGHIGQVVLGDLSQQIIAIQPGLKDVDLAIFLTDSTQEIQKLDELRSLASVGLKAGTVEYRNIIKSYSIDSVKELEKALDYYAELAEKKAQANQEQQQQYDQQMKEQALKVQQAIAQQNAQFQQMDLQLRQAELDLKREQMNLEAQNEKYKIDTSIQSEQKIADIERATELAYLAEDKREADMNFDLDKAKILTDTHVGLKQVSATGKAKENQRVKN